MHNLPTKRAIKDKPGYFNLEVPGKGRHDLKRPFPVYLQLVAEYEPIILEYIKTSADSMALPADSDVEGKKDKAALKKKKLELADSMLTKAPLYFRGIGILIGLYWHHQDKGLDTRYDDYVGNLDEFGDAVVEELYESGYSVEQISQLGSAIVVAHISGRMGGKLLQGRMDFFVETPVV